MLFQFTPRALSASRATGKRVGLVDDKAPVDLDVAGLVRGGAPSAGSLHQVAGPAAGHDASRSIALSQQEGPLARRDGSASTYRPGLGRQPPGLGAHLLLGALTFRKGPALGIPREHDRRQDASFCRFDATVRQCEGLTAGVGRVARVKNDEAARLALSGTELVEHGSERTPGVVRDDRSGMAGATFMPPTSAVWLPRSSAYWASLVTRGRHAPPPLCPEGRN